MTADHKTKICYEAETYLKHKGRNRKWMRQKKEMGKADTHTHKQTQNKNHCPNIIRQN